MRPAFGCFTLRAAGGSLIGFGAEIPEEKSDQTTLLFPMLYKPLTDRRGAAAGGGPGGIDASPVAGLESSRLVSTHTGGCSGWKAGATRGGGPARPARMETSMIRMRPSA